MAYDTNHVTIVVVTIFSTCLCIADTVFDIDELSVQYGIEISSNPVLYSAPQEDENVVQLSSKHGQVFVDLMTIVISCLTKTQPYPIDQDCFHANASHRPS